LPDLFEACKQGLFSQNPPPKIGIHRLDAAYLGKDALSIHRDSFVVAGGDPAFVEALWKPLPEADVLFEEGDAAGPFKVLHLPGHTPGSVGFYDEKTSVLFSGDTLFKGNYGRTDLPGGNEEQIYKSLKRLLSMNAEILVCPGHGPAAKMGNCRGPFFPVM
jgi:glyoxylase-like metal-dependent hydrolase (beta-lactamase superfamily II)